MFAKCCAALAVVLVTFSGLFAEDIKGALFVKYDDKEGATFKVPDATDKDKLTEKTFKVDKDITIKVKKEEMKVVDYLAKAKAKSKFDLTVKDGTITAAKRARGK